MALDHSTRRARRWAALAAAVLLVVPASAAFLHATGAPHFAVDGSFQEWEGVAAVPDNDAGVDVPARADIEELRVLAADHSVFVYARAREAFFAGEGRTVLRVFFDTDADASTGFDLGDLGADLMLESVGSRSAPAASRTFSFDVARAGDDWNGWRGGPPGLLAVRGDQLEAGAGAVKDPFHAVVSVAISRADGGEDVSDPPASARGVLLVTQSGGAPRVFGEGQRGAEALSTAFASWGREGDLRAITFAPTGGANFSAAAGATLTLDDGRTVAAAALGPAKIRFEFAPPLAVGDRPTGATLLLDLRSGEAFRNHAGRSLGATVDVVEGAAADGLVVMRPREIAPTAYLSYVSPTPAVDGAFGEWRLAGALPDALDEATAGGLDVVGVRAMWTPSAAAFFVETREPILPGAALAELPPHVGLQGSPAFATQADPTPPAVAVEIPPLTADDRLLVYLDADRDPTTGFRPAPGVPVGAEFVIQVGGRFSEVKTAHLLVFQGPSSLVSAWRPAGTVKAVAAGASLEGEIPLGVFTGGARLFFQTVGWSGQTADLTEGLQEVVAGQGAPDHYLHFRSAVFDPLAGPPPVRPPLLSDKADGYWVVQLAGAPTSATLGALREAGATLFGYVHSNAYLAKMDEAQARTLGGMEGVRWVGYYQPAFKFPTDPATWGADSVVVLALLFEPDPSLAKQVAAAGGDLLGFTDRSLRVRIGGSDVERLGFIPSIQFIEPENRRVPLNDIGRRLQGVNFTFDKLGVNGSNIVVGISDTGLDFTHPAFDDTGNSTTGPLFNGRILGYFRYGGAYGDSNGHGTHTAGSIAGDGDLSSTVNNTTAGGSFQFRGVAPAASLVVTEIIGATPPSDDKVFADQEAYGATASSNSWGYVDASSKGITDYDASAYLTDQSVMDSNTSKAGLQPMTIVFAAGNDGPGIDTVGTPGTAKNVITVGASESDRGIDTWADNSSSMASFSSRGPTDDGRIKPDVVAVGTYVLSTQSRTSGCACTYGGWDLSWTGANYAFSSGTSQATPQVSGMVALIQQGINETYGRIPSPALVKAALINGAEDLGYGYEYTTGVTGPMSQGWGRVNVSRSISGPSNGTILLFEEGAALDSGDVAVKRIAVANASTPLKVTLVWSDTPGNPVDTKTLAELMNDLDLVVRAPNGTAYHGNKFGGSWSRANNTTFDRLNNVENVFVQAPSSGVWTVEISAFAIKAPRQRFALVVSGNVSEKTSPSVAAAHGVAGAPAGGKLGWNVTAAGSINGDAYTDVIVGAPGASGGSGAAYVFFGGPAADFSNFNVSRANATLSGTAGQQFGWSLDASGDFDGDGIFDLVVGAPGAGKAFIFLGGSNWTNRTANVTFNGSAADFFGGAVHLVPSLDNRSGAEAVVGAPANNSSRGAVYIFSGGGASGTVSAAGANSTLYGSVPGGRLGASLSAGDLDADGSLDLAAGAPGASLVRVVRGGAGPSALVFNATVTGNPGTGFGESLSLDGDLNADGKADLLIGAPLANDSTGAAYIFFGRNPIGDNQVTRHYFFDDMENGTAKWNELSAETVGASPWDLSAAVFAGGAGGGHSWTDSSGNYGNLADASIAFKDPVNLTTASSPRLTFAYRADLEGGATNYDGFLVKYSTNNGSSWTQLDSSNAQNIYDTTVANPGGNPSQKSVLAGAYAFTFDRGTWRTVVFNISFLAGNSSVKFRFQFASDSAVVADGIYIDDVVVREALPSSPNATFYGEAAGDEFGRSVLAIASADPGTTDDFAVGAPGADAGLTADTGAVYVFTGAPTLNGTTMAGSAAEVLRGASAGDKLGWSVAGVSGFNGSGAMYLFAGAPGAGGGAGSALVGDASAPIPEFGDAAAVAFAMAGAVLLTRRGRIRPSPCSRPRP